MNIINPKNECEILMRAVLPLAKRMILESGEFYPYGGITKSNGEIAHVAAKDIATDKPKSKKLIEILRNDFRSKAIMGEISSCAIVYDVRINPPNQIEKVDAIQVNLDHAENYSVEVLFPYTIMSGQVAYGEPFAQKGDYLIFNKNSDNP